MDLSNQELIAMAMNLDGEEMRTVLNSCIASSSSDDDLIKIIANLALRCSDLDAKCEELAYGEDL